MGKIIQGDCENMQITVGGLPIEGTILSKGVGKSSGLVVIEADQVKYLGSNFEDLEDILTKLDSILTQLTVTLTGIDAVTVAPGGQAANIAMITTMQAELALLKEVLR